MREKDLQTDKEREKHAIERTVLCLFSFAMTALMVCIPTACDYVERTTEFSDRTMSLTGILAFLFLGFWAGFPHAKWGD